MNLYLACWLSVVLFKAPDDHNKGVIMEDDPRQWTYFSTIIPMDCKCPGKRGVAHDVLQMIQTTQTIGKKLCY